MRRLPLLLALAGLMACQDHDPTEVMRPGAPTGAFSDAVHNQGNNAFFLLPPMVDQPAYGGTFNHRLRPQVTICELDEAAPLTCAAPLAVYTMTSGTDGATLTISTTDEHYKVNWNTSNYAVTHGVPYRILFHLGEDPDALLLGYADVQFGSNMGELKNLATDQTIALVDGRTLPIRFRIEEGASCGGESDCGEAVVGADGGVVTTAAGFAGVEIPAGALDGDILITIERVDPASQPWGLCLPTGLRQEEGCYDFDTQPALNEVNQQDAFNDDVVVAVCLDPAAQRPEKLVLHKYDPENPQTGVVELANAPETFLSCGGFAYAEPDGLFGWFAGAARRLLRPVAGVVGVRPLWATDAGRGGVTDAFSFVGWAEPADLAVTGGMPAFAGPGATLAPLLQAMTAHNHPVGSDSAASGARLRFEYTDPLGATVVLDPAITDGLGEAVPDWELTAEPGTHTLTVSTRLEIALPGGNTGVITDPTTPLTLTIGGYATAGACANQTDCGQAVVGPAGGVVTTDPGYAGVSIPEGALDGEILVTIQRVNPDSLPWGRCLPTGLRQEEGCYEFDTEPSLIEVNDQDAFNDSVVVAVCIDPDATRPERLLLHKYDPDNPNTGVIELPSAAQTFLTCDNFAFAEPNGLLGRLASAGLRMVRPAARLVGVRSLYATDAGRGGVTDAFSYIGWAEPVDLALAVQPDATTVGITDVVVSALTAHNHGEPPVEDADGAMIRFEVTDPGNVVTDTVIVTVPANNAAEARLSLPAVPGTYNVRVSTQQEILIDAIIIGGGGAGPGLFGAPALSVSQAPFLVPDPTAPVSQLVDVPEPQDDVTGPLFGQVLSPGAQGSPRFGIPEMQVDLRQCGPASEPGAPGSCTRGPDGDVRLWTDGEGNFAAEVETGLWEIRPDPETAGYPGITPRAATVDVPMFDGKGVGVQFTALIVDQEQPVLGAEVNIGIGGDSPQTLAQTFTAGLSAWITEVRLPVECAGTGEALDISIQTIDASGVPSGTIVGSATLVPGEQLPFMPEGSVALVGIPINPVQVEAQTSYALVLDVTPPGHCTLRAAGPTGDSYRAGAGMHFSSPNTTWVLFSEHETWDDIPFRLLVQ